jgi:hypothetical protein
MRRPTGLCIHQVKVFVEPVIRGERGEAGPEDWPIAGGLHPPEHRRMEAHDRRRPPPFKEDEAAMLGAQGVVAAIAPEDAVMEADMRPVGSGNVPMEPVHQSAMKHVLEQIGIQKAEGKSGTDT